MPADALAAERPTTFQPATNLIHEHRTHTNTPRPAVRRRYPRSFCLIEGNAPDGLIH